MLVFSSATLERSISCIICVFTSIMYRNGSLYVATPKKSEKRNAETTEEAPKKKRKTEQEVVVEQPSSTIPNQEENEVICFEYFIICSLQRTRRYYTNEFVRKWQKSQQVRLI